MPVTTRFFGRTAAGEEAFLYEITNRSGMKAILSNYGAILVQLLFTGQDGTVRDLVLGYDTLPEYEAGGFFGATVGRHANRISDAVFTLDGVRYTLVDNDRGCNLHSDFRTGFHKQLWEAQVLPDGVRFSRLSPDGECGFPGNLRISVTYLLRDDNSLHILYEGVSDRKTLINLTNHSFFNLAGHDAGSILEEKLSLFCSSFVEIREGKLPTGRILPVDQTPLDFRQGRRIGEEIDADWDQLHFGFGYDHCLVTGAQGELKLVASVEDFQSNCRMDVLTDLPGVQFYTANALPKQWGKGQAFYEPRCALCLETGYYPDSLRFPDFPQPVFSPGEVYRAETVYRFSSLHTNS